MEKDFVTLTDPERIREAVAKLKEQAETLLEEEKARWETVKKDLHQIGKTVRSGIKNLNGSDSFFNTSVEKTQIFKDFLRMTEEMEEKIRQTREDEFSYLSLGEKFENWDMECGKLPENEWEPLEETLGKLRESFERFEENANDLSELFGIGIPMFLEKLGEVSDPEHFGVSMKTGAVMMLFQSFLNLLEKKNGL